MVVSGVPRRYQFQVIQSDRESESANYKRRGNFQSSLAVCLERLLNFLPDYLLYERMLFA